MQACIVLAGLGLTEKDMLRREAGCLVPAVGLADAYVTPKLLGYVKAETPQKCLRTQLAAATALRSIRDAASCIISYDGP